MWEGGRAGDEAAGHRLRERGKGLGRGGAVCRGSCAAAGSGPKGTALYTSGGVRPTMTTNVRRTWHRVAAARRHPGFRSTHCAVRKPLRIMQVAARGRHIQPLWSTVWYSVLCRLWRPKTAQQSYLYTATPPKNRERQRETTTGKRERIRTQREEGGMREDRGRKENFRHTHTHTS